MLRLRVFEQKLVVDGHSYLNFNVL